MAERRTIGLKSIKIGDIAVDGGMSTSLSALGITSEGTAILEQAEPETTEFYSEELDDPIEIVDKLGKTTLKWAITDFTPANMVKVLGGTVNGVAPADTWEAPSVAANIEKSISIETTKGLLIEIVRAKISARINMNLGKKNIGLVEITATVLTPTKAATPAITIGPVA